MRHWCRSYYLLLLWNLLRIRTDLPIYVVVQTMLSIGVVIGFSFLIPDPTPETALYLCTGGMTVSLITVSMVLAPQSIAYSRQAGFFDYQRSLPVPRIALMAADATVWVGMALPGLVLSTVVAAFRFDLSFNVSPLVIPAVLLVVVGGVAIGYTIAFVVKPTLVSLITNAIIIVALMFAPINFPAEQLPGWLAAIHTWLPFQYMAQAIRETVDVPVAGLSLLPFVVLTAWSGIGLAVTSRVMTRRA
jgi:ABC-2 type transport system permease protein